MGVLDDIAREIAREAAGGAPRPDGPLAPMESPARAGQRRARANETAARKSGAERLRRAADKRVGRNSEKLADVLKDKALAGDLASTKMLVALADGKMPTEVRVKKRSGPSQAELWAAEPPWPGRWPGETEEMERERKAGKSEV